MTSDAKIGLLLGLVFIFIIAFVINGMPSFRNALESNRPAPTDDFVNADPIGARERSVPGVIEEQPVAEDPISYPAPSDDDGIELAHYNTPWQNNSSDTSTQHADQSYYPETYYSLDSSSEQAIDYIPPFDDNVTGEGQEVADAGTQETDRFHMPFPNTVYSTRKVPLESSDNRAGRTAPPQPTPQGPQSQTGRRGLPDQKSQQKPKTYVVKEGDNNLAKIAKKFYGEEEGNRIANVNRIFDANKNVLKSPDKIFVGQTIIIPPPAPPAENQKPSSVLGGTMFERVPSMGGSRQETTRIQEAILMYEVKEDDSLWKIASEQLGKGARFNEISKLNADILTNENKLKPGMKLRLPAK